MTMPHTTVWIVGVQVTKKGMTHTDTRWNSAFLTEKRQNKVNFSQEHGFPVGR